MAEPGRRPARKKKKYPFPWLLLIVFLATVAVFWVFPYVRGPIRPKVIFEPAQGAKP